MLRLMLATLGFIAVVPSACEPEALIAKPSAGDYEVITLLAE